MAKQQCTFRHVLWVLGGEVYVRGIIAILEGVEVGPGDIKCRYLGPIWAPRVEIWHMIPDLGRGKRQHRSEGFQWRCRGKVTIARCIERLHLAGDQP